MHLVGDSGESKPEDPPRGTSMLSRCLARRCKRASTPHSHKQDRRIRQNPHATLDTMRLSPLKSPPPRPSSFPPERSDAHTALSLCCVCVGREKMRSRHLEQTHVCKLGARELVSRAKPTRAGMPAWISRVPPKTRFEVARPLALS